MSGVEAAGPNNVLTEHIDDLTARLSGDRALLDDLVHGAVSVSDPAGEYFAAESDVEEMDAELAAALDVAKRRREIEGWIAALPPSEPEWEFPDFGTPEQPLKLHGITGTPSLRPIGDGDQLLTVDVVEATNPPGSSRRELVLYAGEVALLEWAPEPGEVSPRYAFIGTDNELATQALRNGE